jgi:MFS family permease
VTHPAPVDLEAARTQDEPPSRPIHPFAWTLLIAPFGVIGGFAGVVLAFMATKRGLSVEEGASLVAIGMLPHTWKFAWAPVADMTFSRRGWYLGSAALCIAGLLAMAVVPLGPDTLQALRGIVFLTNLASTTLGMAVEGLMTHHTPPEARGRAGGWFQAGNLGGSGIGGGLGLWLASNLPAPWMGGAVLAGLLALCAAPLLWVPDVPRDQHGSGVLAAVRGTFVDLKDLVLSRDGFLAALICFLPIGTGAAAGVMAQAEVAARWGAGEAEVGTVNGVASGFIAALGCLVGGEICRRVRPRLAYASIGALMALVALIMAVGPLTPGAFILGGLSYALVTGLAYAAFTGLVLESIAGGGAATKYNIFAALSNTPIAYMGMALASTVTVVGASLPAPASTSAPAAEVAVVSDGASTGTTTAASAPPSAPLTTTSTAAPPTSGTPATEPPPNGDAPQEQVEPVNPRLAAAVRWTVAHLLPPTWQTLDPRELAVRGMLLVEALVGLLGIGVFALTASVVTRLGARSAPPSA